MTSESHQATPRPREVTVAGVQIVLGSALVLAIAFNAMAQLRSTQMRDLLAELLDSQQAAGLNLTVESARTLVKYSLLVAGGVAAVALVLGVFLLRRDRSSRMVLTVLGCLIALVTVLGGPPAWIMTAYVSASVLLLWTKSARAWFAPTQPGSGPGGVSEPGHGWTAPPPEGPPGPQGTEQDPRGRPPRWRPPPSPPPPPPPRG